MAAGARRCTRGTFHRSGVTSAALGGCRARRRQGQIRRRHRRRPLPSPPTPSARPTTRCASTTHRASATSLWSASATQCRAGTRPSSSSPSRWPCRASLATCLASEIGTGTTFWYTREPAKLCTSILGLYLSRARCVRQCPRTVGCLPGCLSLRAAGCFISLGKIV